MNNKARKFSRLALTIFVLHISILLSHLNPTEKIIELDYLPIISEVTFEPTPIKAEGKYWIFYEIHLTNMSKMEFILEKVDVLNGKSVTVSFDKDRLKQIISWRPFPSQKKDPLILTPNQLSFVFISISYEKKIDIPDKLNNKIYVKPVRGRENEPVFSCISVPFGIVKQEVLVINPPVKFGTWAFLNLPGLGKFGHRDSMQIWNGRYISTNRYGIDIMKLGEDNRLCKAEGEINENWYCYNEPVTAVEDGKIIEVIDGVTRENTPLIPERAVSLSLSKMAGNVVIQRLKNGVFAVYAHLRPNSIIVKNGEDVKAGQVLGFIGNTGDSDAPHLHFHIQETWNKGTWFGGESIPYVFKKFEYIGRFTKNLDIPLEDLQITFKVKGNIKTVIKELPLGHSVIRIK